MILGATEKLKSLYSVDIRHSPAKPQNCFCSLGIYLAVFICFSAWHRNPVNQIRVCVLNNDLLGLLREHCFVLFSLNSTIYTLFRFYYEKEVASMNLTP